MTKHVLLPNQPDPLDWERMHTNGQVPHSSEHTRMAHGFNHISCYRKKQLAIVCFDPAAPQAFTGTPGAPTVAGSGQFHTGPATTQIIIRYGLLKAVTTGSSYQPAVWLTINGADSQKCYSADTSSGASAFWDPDETTHQSIVVTLAADTDFTWLLKGQHGARLLYMTIAEVPATEADDAIGVIVNPTPYISEGPILNSHASDLITANNTLIKRASAHLLSHNSVEEPSTSSASYVTIWGSESIYLTLDTAYKDTFNRDIDVLWAVDGKLSVSGSGGCKLVDDGATTLAEVTSFTTSRAWNTLQTTIPATADQQVKVQIKGDGTAALTIYGWSLYIYDP